MADTSSSNGVDEVREQDRYLPIANVGRIMKRGVPPNAKIAKDAKETVQECVSEFVSFITSEYPAVQRARAARSRLPSVPRPAVGFLDPVRGRRTASDKCLAEKRKTINGDDVLWAMGTLGFDNYVEPLRVYLQKYREVRGRAPPARLPLCPPSMA